MPQPLPLLPVLLPLFLSSLLPLALSIYATSYGTVFLAACFSTGSIPTSSLRRSSGANFLPFTKKGSAPTFRSTGYRSMAYTPSTGFGSLSDDKDAGSTVDSNAGESTGSGSNASG